MSDWQWLFSTFIRAGRHDIWYILSWVILSITYSRRHWYIICKDFYFYLVLAQIYSTQSSVYSNRPLLVVLLQNQWVDPDSQFMWSAQERRHAVPFERCPSADNAALSETKDGAVMVINTVQFNGMCFFTFYLKTTQAWLPVKMLLYTRRYVIYSTHATITTLLVSRWLFYLKKKKSKHGICACTALSPYNQYMFGCLEQKYSCCFEIRLVVMHHCLNH